MRPGVEMETEPGGAGELCLARAGSPEPEQTQTRTRPADTNTGPQPLQLSTGPERRVGPGPSQLPWVPAVGFHLPWKLSGSREAVWLPVVGCGSRRLLWKGQAAYCARCRMMGY